MGNVNVNLGFDYKFPGGRFQLNLPLGQFNDGLYYQNCPPEHNHGGYHHHDYSREHHYESRGGCERERFEPLYDRTPGFDEMGSRLPEISQRESNLWEGDYDCQTQSAPAPKAQPQLQPQLSPFSVDNQTQPAEVPQSKPLNKFSDANPPKPVQPLNAAPTANTNYANKVKVTKWGTADNNGKRQDCLWNIVKNQYGLTDPNEINNKVDEIMKYHNSIAQSDHNFRVISNRDRIFTDEEILLPPERQNVSEPKVSC